MKREQGFTIVEVIIAVLVLTIGILGLVTSAALVKTRQTLLAPPRRRSM